MTKPREVTIHGSCHRPHLLLGADRQMVLLGALLAVPFFVVGLPHWWAFVIPPIGWSAWLAVWVRLAKADPLLRHVYWQQIWGLDYYPARSGYDAKPLRLPGTWDRRTF